MKTYCISDIHGHKNLRNFASVLNDDDKVYVLGDVIDKGEDPLACLKLVMEDQRFEMIMGNHEYMMYQLLSINEYSPNFVSCYMQWVRYNHGIDTYGPYLHSPKKVRKKIFEYIENLPLNIPEVTVGNRKFYLVHSLPLGEKQVRMADIDYDDVKISRYVWDREPVDEYLRPYEDKTVIAGHTVVQEYLGDECRPYFHGDDIKKAAYIDIDGGLAYGLDSSRLIALCLDDLTYELY